MMDVRRALILVCFALFQMSRGAGGLAAVGPAANPGEASSQLNVRLAGSTAGWPISFNRSFEFVVHNQSPAPIKLLSVSLTTPRALYESCAHARLTSPPENEAKGTILVQSSDIDLTSNDVLKPATLDANQSVTLRFLVNPTPHGDLVQLAPVMDPACWLNAGESDVLKVQLRTADQSGKPLPVITREVQIALYPPPAAILLGLVLGSLCAAVIPWLAGGKPEDIPAQFGKALGVGFVGFLLFFLADAPAFPLQVKFNIYGGFLLGISGTSLIGYFVSLFAGGGTGGKEKQGKDEPGKTVQVDDHAPTPNLPPPPQQPVVLLLPPAQRLAGGDASAPAGGVGADADDQAGGG